MLFMKAWFWNSLKKYSAIFCEMGYTRDDITILER